MEKSLKMLLLLFVALLITAALSASCAIVPPTERITETSIAQAQKKQEVFLGKWEGIWYDRQYPGSLAASLVISRDEQGDINVTYSWEGSQEWKTKKGSVIKKPKFYRNKKGEMVLYFEYRLGSNFEFWIDDNGNLKGWVVGFSSTIVMHRQS